MDTDWLLYVEGLRQTFNVGGRRLRAVDGVDLQVERGEALGIVGESGCGKSTLARALMLLPRPTEGTVVFDHTDVTRLRGRALRRHRQRIQMVFQDPNGSLDPRFSVGASVGEPMRAAGYGHAETRQRVGDVLDAVGIGRDVVDRRPNEFSGGQRQRIGIARAIVSRPELVILDEPTSALDVSIQAQVLNLLLELQSSERLTYLFISHNLSVVRHLAHRVVVMYLGRVVETGITAEVLASPRHPYTAVLLAAAPNGATTGPRRVPIKIEGDLPNPLDQPIGCSFASRCWRATDQCRVEDPMIDPADRNGVACHHPLDAGEGVDTATVGAATRLAITARPV